MASTEHTSKQFDAELEAVRWFSREEAVQLVAGAAPGAFAPPRLAIAHQLIRAWSEGR